jgi:hypothetical protein
MRHKSTHYASKCLEKKGKSKLQKVVELAKIQVDELATKFEEFTLVSCLSTSIITRSVCYVDNGASHYMIEAQDLFNSLIENDSRIHVELDDDAKYVMKGEGTILF